MGEKMTLDDARAVFKATSEGLHSVANACSTNYRDAMQRRAVEFDKALAAIDAHLIQPAQAVDVPKGWSAENLKRCCRELNKLIELAGDYLFDEMTVATFETSIACILVCLAALPNANGKEG